MMHPGALKIFQSDGYGKSLCYSGHGLGKKTEGVLCMIKPSGAVTT